MSSKLWSSQLWAQLKQLRIEAWKSQHYNGVWTRVLAIPVRRSNQLSYEATDVRSWSFVKNGCEVIYDVQLHSSVVVLTFSGFYTNFLSCAHNCDDHSSIDSKFAVQYIKHFIHHFTSIFHGLIRIHKWPAPNVSGFIVQLVRASHRYREVTGSDFFRLLYAIA